MEDFKLSYVAYFPHHGMYWIGQFDGVPKMIIKMDFPEKTFIAQFYLN